MTTEEVDVSGLADPVMSFYLSNTDFASCTFPNTVVVDFYDGSAWHDSAVVVDELLLNTWKYYEVAYRFSPDWESDLEHGDPCC